MKNPSDTSREIPSSQPEQGVKAACFWKPIFAGASPKSAEGGSRRPSAIGNPRRRSRVDCTSQALFAVLSAACLLGTLSAQGKEPQVIAYWSFDEDGPTTLIDSGPNNLNADLTEGESQHFSHVEGRSGKALRLLPEQRCKFTIPDNPSLDLQPPFTIAAWINHDPDGSRAGEIINHLMDSHVDGGYRFRYGWNMTNFQWFENGVKRTLQSPEHAIEDGKWHHVAVTHDGKDVRLYIDFEQVAVEPADSVVDASQKNRETVIGNYLGTPDAYPFAGMLDELVILGEALDGEELIGISQDFDKKIGR